MLASDTLLFHRCVYLNTHDKWGGHIHWFLFRACNNMKLTLTLGLYIFLSVQSAADTSSELLATQCACRSRDEYLCNVIFLYKWAFRMWCPSSNVFSASRGDWTRDRRNAMPAWPERRSHRNLLLSPSSRRISHSRNEGWKNMYVLSSLLINRPDNNWTKYSLISNKYRRHTCESPAYITVVYITRLRYITA